MAENRCDDCPQHPHMIEEDARLHEEVRSLCKWTKKWVEGHEKFADESLDKQRAWKREMEKVMADTKLDTQKQIDESKLDFTKAIGLMRTFQYKSVITILIAIVINLAVTILKP